MYVDLTEQTQVTPKLRHVSHDVMSPATEKKQKKHRELDGSSEQTRVTYGVCPKHLNHERTDLYLIFHLSSH